TVIDGERCRSSARRRKPRQLQRIGWNEPCHGPSPMQKKPSIGWEEHPRSEPPRCQPPLNAAERPSSPAGPARDSVFLGPPGGRPWSAAAACWAFSLRLLIQPRQNLPDGPQVIRRVRGRGESGGGAHVVPVRAGSDDLSPLFGFVAQAVAERSPLIVGNGGT